MSEGQGRDDGQELTVSLERAALPPEVVDRIHRALVERCGRGSPGSTSQSVTPSVSSASATHSSTAEGRRRPGPGLVDRIPFLGQAPSLAFDKGL
ncbi:hypothetical protein [Modestobacter altitudinis]|uniref:hypothetical protein n=1 Tax=Modestobacter altitudinis TaxID=2213158 RepID=UPI00110CC66E|nr:hypothetical protein [Modestobacter altitudinis]